MNKFNQLLGFSLSFEYLRELGGDREEYILQLSQFYVSLMKILRYSLIFNSIIGLLTLIIYIDFIRYSIANLFLVCTILTIVLTYVDSCRMVVDKEKYFEELNRHRLFDKKEKRKIVIKYNVELVIYHILYIIPFILLSLFIKKFI